MYFRLPIGKEGAGKSRCVLLLCLCLGLGSPGEAATLYWDLDDGVLGASAGNTASGVWDSSSAHWNSNADGSGSNRTYANKSDVVFSAGSDATGISDVQLQDTFSLRSLRFEEGTVSLSGGSLLFTDSTPDVFVAAGLEAYIASEITGRRGLIVTGEGSLSLSGLHSYTGNTRVWQGKLKVTAGSVIASSKNVVVDNQGSGEATMSVSGLNASVYASSSVTVGDSNAGALSVVGGARIQSAGHLYLGKQLGSTGSLMMDGVDTQLSVAKNVYVGHFGLASAVLTGGAALSSGKHVYIGNKEGAQGQLSLQGAGTRLWVSNRFYVGNGGLANLTLSEGAEAQVGGTVYFGNAAASSATVELRDAGSRLATDGSVRIANNGSASLTVSDGALVQAQSSITMANNAGSSSVVTVTGSYSELRAGEDIFVGRGGSAQLFLQSGGSVQAGGNVYLAYQESGEGSVFLSGADTRWQAQSIYGGRGRSLIELGGGTVRTESFDLRSRAGEATLLFDGGVVQVLEDSSDFIDTGWFSVVSGGGLVLDSNGFDVTIADALQADETQLGGGLTKRGTGNLLLAGENTYVGDTVLEAGVLSLGSDQVVASASSLVLAGGGFSSAGFDQSWQDLRVSEHSIIDLGWGASQLNFSGSLLGVGSGANEFNLSVYNYTAGLDSLVVDGLALGKDTLQQIAFYSDAGSQFLGQARQLASGELAPVPEIPSSVVVMAVIVFLFCLAGRRYAERAKKKELGRAASR